MTSPSHRASMGFLRGAFIAVVAQVVTAPLAAGVGSLSLSQLAPVVRALLPVAGFALAGAVGGEALGVGRQGASAFAAGGLLAGVVLTIAAPNLSGLTGHENAAIVLAYAVATFAAAFGLCGGVAGAILRGGVAGRSAAAFSAGGAIGGVACILPFFLARLGAESLVLQFAWLASSVGSIAIPLALGGGLTARALHSGRGE
jgi:hypothetical protein